MAFIYFQEHPRVINYNWHYQFLTRSSRERMSFVYLDLSSHLHFRIRYIVRTLVPKRWNIINAVGSRGASSRAPLKSEKTLLFRERVPSSRSHLHRYRHTDREQRRIFTFLACPLLLFLSPPRKFNPTETVSSQQNQHFVFAARTRHTGRRVRRDKRVKGFRISLPLSPRVFARLKCSSRHLLWRAVPRTSERSNLLSWHVPKSRWSRRFRRHPAARSKNGRCRLSVESRVLVRELSWLHLARVAILEIKERPSIRRYWLFRARIISWTFGGGVSFNVDGKSSTSVFANEGGRKSKCLCKKVGKNLE